MARIRQQFPQNYGSSGNINVEFENLIRYINAAELGNKTVGELLEKLFDSNGNFDGPIELQKNTGGDIEYRVGEYTNTTDGWITLVAASELRGPSGQDFGQIGAPIFFGRADYTATAAQTNFDYSHASTDELLVYVNGLLKRPGASNDYTTDSSGGSQSAGQITFNSGLSLNDKVTVYKVRATSITGFKRSDFTPASAQTVFAFVHTAETKLQVYKNGVLLREGGSNDYTTSAEQDTVTLASAATSGDLVSIITVENTSVQAVTGMMFEEDFVHTDSGLIKFNKIKIDNGNIPQAKVASLTTDLGTKAKLTVSSSTPTGPATGDLFLDTSQTPNQLKFYDGTQFLRTSPESSLPTFTSSDAGRFVKVNGTGTALEYGTVDLSSVIPVTQKGAANGVASLDSTGRLPSSQLPSVLSTDSLYIAVATPTNQTYDVKRIYKQKIRIDGLALQTTSGTCSVQISVNGTGLGSTYSVSSTPNEFALGTPIEIDATTSSKAIEFIVTNNSSASALEVTIAISVIAS
jgi:hypothetical protein